MLTPKFPVGTASASTLNAADLGKIYWQNGRGYRLLKATNAIAACARKVVVSAVSGGAFTWSCDVSTTANDTTVAAIIPSNQVGSSGTTGLLAGDYFYGQVSGITTGISAAAIAANVPVGTSTTGGKIDDASITAGVGAIGVSLASAAGADENPGVYLKGMI